MVLDFCPRGDLALYLAQKVLLTEEEARFFICEMLLAIEHLHSLDIIYRDMKPENILIGKIPLRTLIF
jgi:protein kinase/protein kinase A